MSKAFLFLLLFAPSLVAQQYRITSIHVSGSSRFTGEQVARAAGLHVGQSATLEQVRDSAQSLVNSGVFAEVRYRHVASASGMTVEFTLKDRPENEFTGCDFENIVWFPEGELIASLQKRVPLFWGKVPLVGNLPETIAGQLTAMLQEKGFNGHVSATLLTDHNENPKEFEFTVDEVVAHVAEISITGASPDNSDDLQAAARVLVGPIYRRSDVVGAARQGLKSFYSQRGFLQAEFGDPTTEVIATHGKIIQVRVHLRVTEGPRYGFGTVRWSGVHVLSQERVSSIVPTPPGLLVNGVLLNTSLRVLRRLYAEAGYLHMYVIPQPTFHPERGVVDYTIEVREGSLFSMGKLEFSGLTEKSEIEARLLWGIREGEPFNEEYFEKFITSFHVQGDARYMIEKTEGELPNTVDVRIRYCAVDDPCRPAPTQLYEPPTETQQEESQ